MTWAGGTSDAPNVSTRSSEGTSYPLVRRWQEEAACRGVDSSVFFPVTGDAFATARRYCETCPVKFACLDHALRYEDDGFWGGMSPEERRKFKKRIGDRQYRTDRNHLAVVDEGAAVAEAFRGIIATLAAGR